MTFTKDDIINSMQATGMVPVFYTSDVDRACNIIDAAYAGGVRVFEFTNRGQNAFEVFTQLVTYIKKYSDAILGIGTILDPATTKQFIEAGAHFIVSPIFNKPMAEVCHQQNILWIPGCATLTEIVNARDAGAHIIKLFPASVLGPAFVAAITPVIPGLKLMPTGGIEPTEEHLSAWFKAGVVCVGMGSQLIKQQFLQDQNWNKLQDGFTLTMNTITRIKNSL